MHEWEYIEQVRHLDNPAYIRQNHRLERHTIDLALDQLLDRCGGNCLVGVQLGDDSVWHARLRRAQAGMRGTSPLTTPETTALTNGPQSGNPPEEMKPQDGALSIKVRIPDNSMGVLRIVLARSERNGWAGGLAQRRH